MSCLVPSFLQLFRKQQQQKTHCATSICLMANQNDAIAEINEQHRQEDCLWKQKQLHEYFDH